MPYVLDPTKRHLVSPTFNELFDPINNILQHTPTLESRGDRPLQLDFEHQLKSLVFFHLEEHKSGSHLVQALKQDDFAKNEIASAKGK